MRACINAQFIFRIRSPDTLGRPPPYLGRLQSAQGAGPVGPTTTAVALPGAAGSRSAVNPRPKSVVQESCTLRSVGGGGGRLHPPTRWASSNGRLYRECVKIKGQGGQERDKWIRL